MKFFNSNMIHNLLNVVIAVNGFLLWLGCSINSVTGQASCTQEWIPPSVAIILVTIAGVLKIVINIGRDGLGGLTKVQPPVADKVTTVVQPVKVEKV